MLYKTEASVPFDSRIKFPVRVLARPPETRAPDNLLRGYVSNDDIVVSIPLPLSAIRTAKPGDLLSLVIDGVPVGEPVVLPPGGDAVSITLRAADRPLTTSLAPRKVRINYQVEDRAAGIAVPGPGDQSFMTHVRMPGGQSLAPLSFGPEVTKHGITRDAIVRLTHGGEYVLATVKGYYGASVGDEVYGIIDGDERMTTDPFYVDESYEGGDIALRFPLALLRLLNGSERGFSYRIVDRAFNVSIAPPPVDVLIELGPTAPPFYPAHMYDAIDRALLDKESCLVITRHDLSDEDLGDDDDDDDDDEGDAMEDFIRADAVDELFNEWTGNNGQPPRPEADSASH